MSNSDNIKNIKKISKANSGFKMPEGYLENLEDRLEMRIEAFESIEKPQAKLIRIIKPILTMAACFVLAVLLFKYSAQQVTTSYLVNNEEEQTYDMVELAASMYSDEAYLADLIIPEGEHLSSYKEDERILDELSDYVSDLDVVDGFMNE